MQRNKHNNKNLGKSNLFFFLHGQSGELFRVGGSAKLSFRVGTSKNKNTDYRVNGTCAICQYKIHIEPTTSLYSVIQQCQMH